MRSSVQGSETNAHRLTVSNPIARMVGCYNSSGLSPLPTPPGPSSSASSGSDIWFCTLCIPAVFAEKTGRRSTSSFSWVRDLLAITD